MRATGRARFAINFEGLSPAELAKLEPEPVARRGRARARRPAGRRPRSRPGAVGDHLPAQGQRRGDRSPRLAGGPAADQFAQPQRPAGRQPQGGRGHRRPARRQGCHRRGQGADRLGRPPDHAPSAGQRAQRRRARPQSLLAARGRQRRPHLGAGQHHRRRRPGRRGDHRAQAGRPRSAARSRKSRCTAASSSASSPSAISRPCRP